MKYKWMQFVGDFFYRYCQRILLGVFIVSVCTIVVIKLNFFIGTSDYAEIINDMLVNLSYSYIAAYLFYLMTSRLPVVMRKRKLMPVIQNRVEEIGRRSIYYVLLEFSRDNNELHADYKHIDGTEDVLASKVWTDEMPTVHRQFGIRINYLNYVRHQCDDLKERVAVVLDRYKDEMTEEQITALEEMTGLYIFRLLELFSSLPKVQIESGVNPMVEEYCKLHKKYLEVERLFGIEAKD
jgi:hypothetical protein